LVRRSAGSTGASGRDGIAEAGDGVVGPVAMRPGAGAFGEGPY
jgi:hypothetical protein